MIHIVSEQTWSNSAKCVFQCKTVYFGHSNTGNTAIIQVETVPFGQLQIYSKMCVSDRNSTFCLIVAEKCVSCQKSACFSNIQFI